MANSNISFRGIVNATIHVDNSSDESRTMDISADANFIGDSIDNFQSGQAVPVDGGPMASFSESSNGFFNIVYTGGGTDEQTNALKEIRAFIENARSSAPLSMLCNENI